MGEAGADPRNGDRLCFYLKKLHENREHLVRWGLMGGKPVQPLDPSVILFRTSIEKDRVLKTHLNMN